MQQQQRQFSLQSPSHPAINFQAPRQNAQKVQSSRTVSSVNGVGGKTQQILDQLNSFVTSQHTQQETKEKLVEKCSKQEQLLGETRTQVQGLRSERAKITEQLRMQETTVGQVEVQAQTYKNQFHSLQNSIHQSKAKIDAGESTVTKLEEWKDTVDARLANMQSAFEEAIARNTRKQEEFTKERDVLQTEIDDLKSRIAATNEEKANLEASVADKDSKLSQTQAQLSTTQTESALLKTKLDKLERSHQESREREAGLQTQIGVLNKKLDEMKSEKLELASALKSQKKAWEVDIKRHEQASFADKAKMAEAHRAEKTAAEDKIKLAMHECEMKEAVSKEKLSHLQEAHQASKETIEKMSAKIESMSQESAARATQLEQMKTAHDGHDAHLTLRCSELEASVLNFDNGLMSALEKARLLQSDSAAKLHFLEERLKEAEASSLIGNEQQQEMDERFRKLQEEFEAQKTNAENFERQAQELTAKVSEKEKAYLSAEEKWNDKLKENMIKSQEYFAKCQTEMKTQHDAEIGQMKSSREQLEQKVNTMGKELETTKVALRGAQEASSKHKAKGSQKEKEMASRIKELEKELQGSKEMATRIEGLEKELQGSKEMATRIEELEKELQGSKELATRIEELEKELQASKELQLKSTERTSMDCNDLEQKKWFPGRNVDSDAGGLNEDIESSRSVKFPPSKRVSSKSLAQDEEPSSASRTKKGTANLLKPKPTTALQARFGPEISRGSDPAPVDFGRPKGKTPLRSSEMTVNPQTPSRPEDSMPDVSSMSQPEDPSTEKTIKKRKRSHLDGPSRSTSSHAAKRPDSQPKPQMLYGSQPVSVVPAKSALKRSTAAAKARKDTRPDPRLVGSPAGSERSIDLFSCSL